MVRTTIIGSIDSISVNDVRPGCLVLRPLEPHQDYCYPHYASVLALAKTIPKSASSHARKKDAESTVMEKVMRALGAMFGRKKHRAQETSAGGLETCKLMNPEGAFKEACQDRSAREWMETACNEGSDVYFIVGYRIVTETVRSASGKTYSASAVMNGDDASVSREQQHQKQPRQTVRAIQYRKLQLGFLSSRQVGDGVLRRGSRWVLTRTLGEEGEATGEDGLDTMGASLEDSVKEVRVGDYRKKSK